MVAVDEVEESGRLSAPLRAAVETALAAYALEESRVRPLSAGGINATFRIEGALAGQGAAGDAAAYVLRITRADDLSAAALESELTWLAALRRDAGLLVPEPVVAADGSRIVHLPADGGAQQRHAVLFHWLPGEVLSAAEDPLSYLRVGEFMARLHRHSERFAVPPGFERPRYDPQRILGAGEVIPAGRGEALLSPGDRADLDEAAGFLRTELRKLGRGPGVFGLIHGDLQVTNYLFHHGKVGAIDFADFGWGYYLYDVAASLLPAWEQKGFPGLREAFLRGYRRVRPLTEADEASLEPLAVARALFVVRWTIEHWDHPAVRETGQNIVPHLQGHIRRFLDRQTPGRRPPAAGERRTVPQLLSHFRGLGIRLWEEEGRLRFKAAKGALTPELRAELSTRKSEILDFLRQTTAASASAPPIVPQPRTQEIPLSFAQERLWILAQFDPASPVYNIFQAVRLEGPLRPAVLERCFGEIVRRHETLRTSFATVDGRPVQRIAPASSPSLPVVDLRGLPGTRGVAAALAAAEGARPFDLATGPLVRFLLLRQSPEEHRLLLNVHHIISDGWSSGILIRELAALYEAFAAAAPSPLPELPIQYADFSGWQRRWLGGEVLERQLSYWREQLTGVPELLELPIDRPRPPVQTTRGNRLPVAFPAELTAELQAVSRQREATLFMALLAALKALLYRITGRREIVVGSPIANRNRGEIEGLIGFFVNTLVLRAELSGGTAFRELLEQVRRVTLGAYAHQDLPFEKLVEELRPERNPSHTPLFQVCFVLQNAPSPALRVPGLTLSFEDPVKATAKFDLTVTLWETAAGLRGTLNYNTDLFDDTTIQRLARQLTRVAHFVTRQPDRPLAEAPLLEAADRQQLLREWNDAAGDFPGELSIARLFELQAEQMPEAVAVVFDDESLSYGELNLRANRLAHYLLARVTRAPELMVAISMERSPRTVVAILAILKAGGVYVPLDPAFPPERLDFMLEDAEVPALITEKTVGEGTPARFTERGIEIVCLDRDAAAIARASDRNPAAGAAVGGDRLAYVIYTSGSTGIPKGVAVSHRAVARLVFHTNYIDLGADDRVAQASTTSFDAATFELWGALVHGGRLVGIGKDVAIDPPRLAAVLSERAITVLFLTTALFNQMMREQPSAFSNLRHLLFGGEAVDPHQVREALADGAPERLLHVYGPTESTTYASWYRVREVAPGARTVPIGGPLANTELYVLDRMLAPVPVGVAGELLIGGAGLARGYLKRPELTAECFVPHPFASAGAGERLYRTGDLVRCLPEGAIEFLGRLDFQVKIRGFRIELGEIEAVLDRHPAVREAVVVPREGEGEGADKQLAAFLVAEPDTSPTIEELSRFLRSKLPGYMVPASFVTLEELPLNPNGKVDRTALAAGGGSELESEVAFVAPRNELEQQLAEIWAELLGQEPIGIYDNFFDRGGNSLLATQVISRVRDTLQVEIPLASFFEASNVAGLAESIEVARRIAQDRDQPRESTSEVREEWEL